GAFCRCRVVLVAQRQRRRTSRCRGNGQSGAKGPLSPNKMLLVTEAALRYNRVIGSPAARTRAESFAEEDVTDGASQERQSSDQREWRGLPLARHGASGEPAPHC